jgi:hypothetical protein
VRGNRPDNVYAVGYHGYAAYFDGQVWNYITEYENQIVDFVSVQPFDDEVFILADYYDQAYVVRGKITY